MTTSLSTLQTWVDEVATLTKPQKIHWCDGSDAEYQGLVNEMLQSGVLSELNQKTHPGCYLHLSDPTELEGRAPDVRQALGEVETLKITLGDPALIRVEG